LIVWVLLPDDKEGWRPYTFDKELAELKTQYAIPDEENAAFAYEEIFENLDVVSNQPEFYLSSRPSSKEGPWLSKDHPETAEWFKGHQDTIEKLIKTSKRDKCIFLPISAEIMSYNKYMEHLPKVRQCAFLLISAANNDIAEGRIDAAIEKHFCIIQMANHMYQQPTTIQHLVGFAIEHLALARLNRFVIEGQPSPEQLILISDSIVGVENNWSTLWPRVLEFQKLYTKNMICCIAYEKNAEGKVRLNRGILSLTDEQLPQKLPPPSYFRRKLYKAKTILQWFIFPSAPEKIGKIVDESYAKYYAMADPGFDWDKEPDEPRPRWKLNYRSWIELLANLSEQSYYRIYEIYLRNLTLPRGSRLLIAIKKYHTQHGTWPESLNAIKSGVPAEAFIDPANGNEFEYENHGERFSLFGETINIWPK
jgi:hypothetical protein